MPDSVPGTPPPGSSPVAVNDDAYYQILQPSTPISVLGNDLDGNPGATWNYSSLAVAILPQFGLLTLDSTSGQFLYTPNYLLPPGLPPGSPPPPAQQDSFTYHVKNSLGMQTNMATVTLNPIGSPKNGYIIANPDIAFTRTMEPVVIDLLANDELRDIGRQFDYTSVTFEHFPEAGLNPDAMPRNGTVSFNPTTGAATYTANFGYVGWDRFAYQVSTNVGGPNDPFPGEFFTSVDEVFVVIGASPPRLQTDPQGGGQMLVIDGTNQADSIVIVPGNRRGEVKAILNGVASPSFRPTSRIVVFGYGGDDTIVVSPLVRNTAWLVGGSDNDVLMAGGGPSLLLGGDGNDSLLAGLDRDLLIGGDGDDSLTSAFGADILIGGTTRFDLQPAALGKVFADWAHLPPHGHHRRHRLTNADVLDDGNKDTLLARRGIDVVFATTTGVADDVVLRRGSHDRDSWHDRDLFSRKLARRPGSYSLMETLS